MFEKFPLSLSQCWGYEEWDVPVYPLSVGTSEDRRCGGCLPGYQVCSYPETWSHTQHCIMLFSLCGIHHPCNIFLLSQGSLRVLVKALLRVYYGNSLRRVPYQASRPHPSSRIPVVYERIRCLNRFVALFSSSDHSVNSTVFVITVLITN